MTKLQNTITECVRDARFDFDSEGHVIFYTAMPAGAVENKLRGVVEVSCERDQKVTIVTLPSVSSLED
jgi:hypothetical protein